MTESLAPLDLTMEELRFLLWFCSDSLTEQWNPWFTNTDCRLLAHRGYLNESTPGTVQALNSDGTICFDVMSYTPTNKANQVVKEWFWTD